MQLEKEENSRYLFLDTARHLLLCHQLHVLMLVRLCHLCEKKKLMQVLRCPIITTWIEGDWTIEIQHMFRIGDSQDSADKNTCGQKN